jgi:iron(III) transport system permease protein
MSNLPFIRKLPQQRVAFGQKWTTVSHILRFGTQLIAVAVGTLALLPLAYIVMRAADADFAMLDYLLSPRGLTVIGKSLGLMFAVMGGTLLIGIPFAWLTSRTDLPYRRLWLALGILPMVTPTYLIAVTYIFAFGPRGMLQQALEPLLGIERLPPIYGFFGTWLVLTLCTFPYVVLPLSFAFTRITPALEEAASDLGANRRDVLRYVMMPLCRPALISGVMLAGLYSLSDFGAATIMRYDNFIQVIHLQYTSSFDRHRGAGFALILVFITLILLLLVRRADSNIAHITTGTPGHSESPIKLGHWLYPAVLFCSSLIGLGVVTPFGVILYWLLNKTVTRSVHYDVLTLTMNTVSISAVTAVISVAIGILLANLMNRSGSWLVRWIGRLTFLGYVLPGLVVGLALVFFTSRYLPAWYQTMPIFIMVYVVRFLPISLSATQSAFAQVNPRMEESAQSLGAVGWQVMTHITLPLSRSGIIGGMVLVFVAVMKELPIALMLAPTGFHTLSYRIWSAYQEAIFSQIGLPGLLLMLTSIVSIWLILQENQR